VQIEGERRGVRWRREEAEQEREEADVICDLLYYSISIYTQVCMYVPAWSSRSSSETMCSVEKIALPVLVRQQRLT
jgi:hypothetical protein